MSGRAASDAVIPGRAAISVGNPDTPLPMNWVWTPLTSVADLGTGHTPSRKHPEYWGGDVPWIGIRDAGAHHGGAIYDTLQRINQLGLDNSSARLLPKDTVCLSRTASVGYVVKMGRDMATSQDFVTWSCTEALDPDFLMQALLAEGADIRRFGEGSTHTTIYFPEVKAFHVALPPLPEQRRIVAKIDSLTAKSARSRDHLNHIPRLVEKYKQAVLAAAFRGDLTRAWAGEPWLPTTVEDIALAVFDGPFGSNLKSSDYTDYGVRVVRLENIGHLRFILEKETYISKEKYASLARHTLSPDDIIVSSFVADEMRVCRFPAGLNERAINKADCFCVRVNTLLCVPRFLELRLASLETFEELKGAVHGATRPRIALSQLRAFQFDLPSLDEQQAIVQRIERAFTWIDRLAAEATSARALVDRLDQAVLAKAFRGELVPQDPADEPASVLLERIRAERAAAPKPKRGRRPKAAG